MIRCVCQHCSNPLEVGDPYAGAKISCKKCRAIVRIPAAGLPPDTPAEVMTPPPPGAPPAPMDAPPKLAVKPAAAPQPPAKAAPKPAAPAAPAPAAARGAPPRPPVVKPTPGSAPGTTPKPPPLPAPGAKAPPPRPTPGSGPGTVPKPPPAAAPRAHAPEQPVIQMETLSPMLVTIEAVRFGCAVCGAEVHGFLYQIGLSTECPACKGQTPVPAPLEGGGEVVIATPLVKKTPGSGPGTAQKPPVAPPPKGARPAPAPGQGPKAAAPTAQGIAPKPGMASKGAPPRPGAARGFRFPCPHCRAPMTADVSHAGLMMICQQCKQNVAVPEPAPAS